MWFIALLALTACDTESEFEKRVNEDDDKIASYLANEGITATKDPSGIYYQVLEESDDPEAEVPEANDRVSVDYNVKTLSGTSLGSSLTDGPADFANQSGRLAPEGIINGIRMMKNGEKFRLYIPSYLAFGNYSTTDFPANTNLIVDVKINRITGREENLENENAAIQHYLDSLDIDNVEQIPDDHYDADLYFHSIEEGDGANIVNGDWIKLAFKRKYLDGTIIKQTGDEPINVQFVPENFVPGLYDGLHHMKHGGKALLVMPSALGFGASFQVIPQSMIEQLVDDELLADPVKPFSPLIYEVEVID